MSGPNTGKTEVEKSEVTIPQSKPLQLPGGDVEKGRLAFVSVGCIQCHLVEGADVPEPAIRRLDLNLAVEGGFVNTYQDLVLAIVNPRHVMNEKYGSMLREIPHGKDVEPFMPDLAENMTAKQLIDLVTFLDVHYRKLPGYSNE